MTKQDIIKLIDKGIVEIEIHYAGSGDDGAIEDVIYKTADETEVRLDNRELYDKTESLAHEYLNTIEDWWNNDGGRGKMIIYISDINDIKYEIENEIVVVEYETYYHNGCINDNLEEI